MLAPIIPSISDAQEEFTYVAQSPDLSGYYPVEKEIDSTLNGSIVFYYGDKEDLADYSVQMEATYDKGLLNGAVKIYTNDGNIYCEGQFSNNKKSGEWKYYGSNGVVLETGHYNPALDQSFQKSDPMIEPFLTPSYFEYGIDTAAYWELKSAHIIPFLNVGLYRSEGRSGFWKFFNENGELVSEKSY